MSKSRSLAHPINTRIATTGQYTAPIWRTRHRSRRVPGPDLQAFWLVSRVANRWAACFVVLLELLMQCKHLKCDGHQPLCARCADKNLECVWVSTIYQRWERICNPGQDRSGRSEMKIYHRVSSYGREILLTPLIYKWEAFQTRSTQVSECWDWLS